VILGMRGSYILLIMAQYLLALFSPNRKHLYCIRENILVSFFLSLCSRQTEHNSFYTIIDAMPDMPHRRKSIHLVTDLVMLLNWHTFGALCSCNWDVGFIFFCNRNYRLINEFRAFHHHSQH
jgi:hypothetical protein